jgi:hypothetical protein
MLKCLHRCSGSPATAQHYQAPSCACTRTAPEPHQGTRGGTGPACWWAMTHVARYNWYSKQSVYVIVVLSRSVCEDCCLDYADRHANPVQNRHDDCIRYASVPLPFLTASSAPGHMLKPSPTGTFAVSSQNTGLAAASLYHTTRRQQNKIVPQQTPCTKVCRSQKIAAPNSVASYVTLPPDKPSCCTNASLRNPSSVKSCRTHRLQRQCNKMQHSQCQTHSIVRPPQVCSILRHRADSRTTNQLIL